MQQPPDYPPIEREVEASFQSYAIFADDVRREDNGKLLLIGVYIDDLIVPKFPAAILGLNICIVSAWPAQRGAIDLTLRVYQGEKLIAEMKGLGQETPLNDRSSSATPGLPRVRRLRTFVKMPPLMFDGPTAIRVRAETGNEVHRSGMLRVIADERPSNES